MSFEAECVESYSVEMACSAEQVIVERANSSPPLKPSRQVELLCSSRIFFEVKGKFHKPAINQVDLIVSSSKSNRRFLSSFFPCFLPFQRATGIL